MIEAMRAYVSEMYGGNWPNKVREMPDRQVIAIYKNMRKRGVRPVKDAKQQKETCKQLNMFEEGYFN